MKNLRNRTDIIEEGLVFELCRKLSSTVGLAGVVTVGVCDKVVTPILIGVFRPMILLPTSAITGWSAEQLEMVLLHELAHVRRWDNLVNIAQRTVESLLFFHPAVWIISSWVRCERECSCDQIVLKHTGKPREYVAALVSLAQAHGVRTASVAMADRSLVSRVSRILQIEQPTSRYSSQTVSAFVLAVLALIIGIGFTQLGASARPYMVNTDPAEGVILELEGAWPDGKLFDMVDENTGLKTKVYAFDTAIPKYKVKTNRKISTSVFDINGLEFDVSQGYLSLKIDCLFPDDSYGERVGLVMYLYGRNSKLLGLRKLLEPDTPIVASGNVQVNASFPEVNLLDIQSYKLSLRGPETTVTIDSSPVTKVARRVRLQNTTTGQDYVTFSTGTTVELVGISNNPKDDNSWWAPDGTPLSISEMRRFNRNSAIEVPAGAYAFAFKLGGNLERHDTAYVDIGQAARSQDVATLPISETGELLKIQAAYPYADLQKTDLRFAIKTKVWVTHATCAASEAAELPKNRNMYSFIAKPPAEFHGDTILEVVYRESEFRVLAVDQAGTAHEPDYFQPIGGKGKLKTAILRFDSLTPEDIEQYRLQKFQVAGWEWVDYQNVSLKQGELTNTVISVRPPTIDTSMLYDHRLYPSLMRFNTKGELCHTNPAAGVDSIVIDDDFSTGITFKGNWQWRNSAHDKYGPGYHFAHAEGKGATATYIPDIPRTGRYEVYSWWTQGKWRQSDTQFIIQHADGIDVVSQNQKSNGGQWNYLGTYDFDEGTGGSVKIVDSHTAKHDWGIVIADAVMFKPVSETN